MREPCRCSLGPLAVLGPEVWVVCLVGCSLCPPVRLVPIVQVLQEPSDPEARRDGAEVGGEGETTAHGSPTSNAPRVDDGPEPDDEQAAERNDEAGLRLDQHQ